MSDKLDPALRALLDAERSAPLTGAAEAKAQILAKVLAAGSGAAAAGAGAAASGAAATWSTKALLLVALGAGGIGAVVGSVVTTAVSPPDTGAAPFQSNPAESDEPPDQATEVNVTDEADELSNELLPESLVDEPVPLGAERPARMRTAAETEAEAEAEAETEAEPSTLAAERALIDQALSALRARQAQDALVALMSHERRFARGVLSEERDRLSVEALVQLGRTDQALRRAELFEARYPGSAHLPRIRSLIGD